MSVCERPPLTLDRVIEELRAIGSPYGGLWSDDAVIGWHERCPYLDDGGGFAPNPQGIYPSEKFETIKERIAAVLAGRWQHSDGTWRLSAERVLERLGEEAMNVLIGKRMPSGENGKRKRLRCLKRLCSRLGLAQGQTLVCKRYKRDWWLEDAVEVVRAYLLLPAGYFNIPRDPDPLLDYCAAARFLGVVPRRVLELVEEGKLEADPSLKRPRKDGWGYVQTFRQSALQPLKVVRERAAGGAIPTDQGLRLPLKVAAKERRLGLPVTVLRRATKKCELLPEGKLPSEKWPPGGPDNGVITILEADGIRFKKAWNRAVKLGQTI